jgi:hypothetical protein
MLSLLITQNTENFPYYLSFTMITGKVPYYLSFSLIAREGCILLNILHNEDHSLPTSLIVEVKWPRAPL